MTSILEPPSIYVAFRSAIHNKEGADFTWARNEFYKKHEDAEPTILEFFEFIRDSRRNGTLPIEKVEMREDDGKKHGRVEPLMIWDIEYYRDHGQLRQKKLYIKPLGGPVYSPKQNYAPIALAETQPIEEHEYPENNLTNEKI